MQSFKLTACALLLFVCTQSHGAVKIFYESAEGMGRNRNEAIINALTNASSQAFGLSISEDLVSELEVVETADERQVTSRISESLSKYIRRKTRSPVNRPIVGYTFDSVQQLSTEKWAVKITMKYSVYTPESSVSEKRRTVVVNAVDSASIGAAQQAEVALTATRRFRVIERGIPAIFKAEKDFLRSGRAPTEELSRLGRELAADYILVVEHSVDKKAESTVTLAMTGEKYSSVDVSGRIFFRIFDSSTQELKWSSEHGYVGQADSLDAGLDVTQREAVKKSVKRLASELSDAIYPMRVLDMDPVGGFYVNRGRGVLETGDRFMIYRTGGRLDDVQSGESLGEREFPLGEANVVSVFPKYSVLHMVDPKVSKPRRGDIARRLIDSKEDVKPLGLREADEDRNDWLLNIGKSKGDE